MPDNRNGQRRYGMNDRMPCGTSVARRRHLARGQSCDTCGTDRDPDETQEVASRGA